MFIYFHNRSLLLRVLMGHQRGDTETHTKREAASTDSRPGIARTHEKKHHFHYKTNAFLLIFNFLNPRSAVKLSFLYPQF